MVSVCKRFKIVINYHGLKRLKDSARVQEPLLTMIHCSHYCNSCDSFKQCEVAWESRGERSVCKKCRFKFLCMTSS